MSKNQLLLKQARVSSIPDKWRITRVGECCSIRNDLRKPISVDERALIQGVYPYYGPTGILDYINKYLVDGEFALIGEDGDHFLKPEKKPQTILVQGKFNVNNHAHLIESTTDCSAQWFAVYFSHRNITDFLSRQGANRYKLNKATLEKLPILLPPLPEQKAIAKLLSTWDEAIEKTERLIQAKEKRFKSLLSILICSSEFKRRYIRDFTTEFSTRNKEQKVNRVLSVTNHGGFVLPEEYFARSVASSNLSNYKIVLRGQYAYNPSRINVGSINRLNFLDQGVLSPMYVVFGIDELKIDSDFFFHWLSSHEAQQRIAKSAQGSVRETVSFSDFGSIPFPTPNLHEQKQISTILNLVQQEIDLLKQLAEKYKIQKRGLMQKMLTGEWRVKPEVQDEY